jgi:hypothetical protein
MQLLVALPQMTAAPRKAQTGGSRSAYRKILETNYEHRMIGSDSRDSQKLAATLHLCAV